MRLALTALIAAQGDGNQGPQVEHRGNTLERLPKPHRRRYVSIYGPLEIRRFVYGTREGQEIEHVPLDARLGLPAGESPTCWKTGWSGCASKTPFGSRWIRWSICWACV